MATEQGLRARKNARTREAIERAALELALEQGYDHTTVDQIAARADVAPRTVFSRYATKDAIIFGDPTETSEMFRAWLDGGGAEGDLVERMIAFLHEAADDKADTADLERLRMRAILEDDYLRRALRGRLDTIEGLVAAQVAGELDLGVEDTGPQVFAAAFIGLMMALMRGVVADPDFDALTECAGGLAVLAGALDALRSR